MKRRQQIITLLLFILLSSAILALVIPGSALGQMTIPTRTPTPNPGDPTDPPPTDDSGGGNKTPSPTDPPPSQSSSTPSTNPTDTPVFSGGTQVATNTSQPPGFVTGTATSVTAGAVGTMTATRTVPATTTSIGSEPALGTTPISFPVVATAFPTAQPCAVPPTFTTMIAAKFYSGPGNDYELIDTLEPDETRPIVGRAIYSSWWLIQLDGKFNQAWINDTTGIVQGNTNHVPEIQAPKIDGVTPTPGIQWEPTPDHACDLTPTVTVTSPAEAVVSGIIIDDGEDSFQNTDTSASLDSETYQRNLVASTAVPLDILSAARTPNLLPIAGLVLIIAAVFVALFLRRSPGGDEPSA